MIRQAVLKALFAAAVLAGGWLLAKSQRQLWSGLLDDQQFIEVQK